MRIVTKRTRVNVNARLNILAKTLGKEKLANSLKISQRQLAGLLRRKESNYNDETRRKVNRRYTYYISEPEPTVYVRRKNPARRAREITPDITTEHTAAFSKQRWKDFIFSAEQIAKFNLTDFVREALIKICSRFPKSFAYARVVGYFTLSSVAKAGEAISEYALQFWNSKILTGRKIEQTRGGENKFPWDSTLATTRCETIVNMREGIKNRIFDMLEKATKPGYIIEHFTISISQ